MLVLTTHSSHRPQISVPEWLHVYFTRVNTSENAHLNIVGLLVNLTGQLQLPQRGTSVSDECDVRYNSATCALHNSVALKFTLAPLVGGDM